MSHPQGRNDWAAHLERAYRRRMKQQRAKLAAAFFVLGSTAFGAGVAIALTMQGGA